MPQGRGYTVALSHRIAKTMGIGVPFIFQILLLLALPLAFVYLISVIGLLLGSLRPGLAIPPPSGQNDPSRSISRVR